MNIGSVIKNERGFFAGRISTLTLSLTIYLRPIERKSASGPSFDILARNVAGEAVAVGALWEKTAAETGEIYYNGRIEDPSLAAPVPIAVFVQRDGSMNVAWNRPSKAAAAMKGRTMQSAQDDDLAAAPGFAGDEGDGLGESTAPSARGRKTKAPAEAPFD